MQEGECIWIKVQNNSYESSENPFTVSATSMNTSPIFITGEVNESYTLLGQEEQYFEYTVNETGLYNITIGDSNIQCYYTNAQSGYNNTFNKECAFQLTVAQNFSFKLVNNSSNKCEITLKIDKVDTDGFDTVSLEEKALLNFKTYGQTQWRAVSIKEDGNYTITARCTDNTGDFFVEGIEPDKTTRKNPYSGNSSDIDMYNLSAGTTIYIKVYPYNSEHINNPEQSYEHDVNILVTKN